MIGYCKKVNGEVLSEADCVFCKDVDLTCCRYWRECSEMNNPQNLPKADAYSLLAEVRAWLKQNKNHADHYCVDVEVVRVEKLDDFLFKYISDHFS